jgi:hypothetical protein
LPDTPRQHRQLCSLSRADSATCIYYF